MNKKEALKEELRKAFIENAKSLIRGEGVRAATARNIAQETGYSYAVLYNYFADLREILFLALRDFADEAEMFAIQNEPEKIDGADLIARRAKSWANYFVQYPGIFELIFIDQNPEIAAQDALRNRLQEMFEKLFFSISGFPKNKSWLFQSALIGLLTQYLRRKDPQGYKEFISILESSIRLILED